MTRLRYDPFFFFFFFAGPVKLDLYFPRGNSLATDFPQEPGKKNVHAQQNLNTPVRFPRVIQSPESWNMTGTQWEWHQQYGYSVLCLL